MLFGSWGGLCYLGHGSSLLGICTGVALKSCGFFEKIIVEGVAGAGSTRWGKRFCIKGLSCGVV